MEQIIKKDIEQAVTVIRDAICRSQHRAVKAVNRELLSLYYGIGRYVSENSRKGFWGKGAIATISERLQQELPGLRGFSESSIKNMRQFYEEWADYVNRQPVVGALPVDEKLLLMEIRQPAVGELDWEDFVAVPFTHHMLILAKVKTLEERLFYIHECRVNAWNKYTLTEYLNAGLFANRALMPNNFSMAIPDAERATQATMMFKDNYLLDFINVEKLNQRAKDRDERVIENEIVENIKEFILRFGQEFYFIGHQQRLQIAGEEEFIDLLFFNRKLNALVAVELKDDKFRPAYLGQLNTYLTILDETRRMPHENPSIGIVLCREMNKGFVEIAIRDYKNPMGVATYRTLADAPKEIRDNFPDLQQMAALLDKD